MCRLQSAVRACPGKTSGGSRSFPSVLSQPKLLPRSQPTTPRKKRKPQPAPGPVPPLAPVGQTSLPLRIVIKSELTNTNLQTASPGITDDILSPTVEPLPSTFPSSLLATPWAVQHTSFRLVGQAYGFLLRAIAPATYGASHSLFSASFSDLTTFRTSRDNHSTHCRHDISAVPQLSSVDTERTR